MEIKWVATVAARGGAVRRGEAAPVAVASVAANGVKREGADGA